MVSLALPFELLTEGIKHDGPRCHMKITSRGATGSRVILPMITMFNLLTRDNYSDGFLALEETEPITGTLVGIHPGWGSSKSQSTVYTHTHTNAHTHSHI